MNPIRRRDFLQASPVALTASARNVSGRSDERGLSRELKAALLVADGVNETEYIYSLQRSRELGFRVRVIAMDGVDCHGEDHMPFRAGLTIGNAQPDRWTLVLIPGGYAPEKIRQVPRAIEIVKKTYARGGVIGAICHGQMVLISAGLLKGRKAVSATSLEDDLHLTGAILGHGGAVRDGRIITARYPVDLPAWFQLLGDALGDVLEEPEFRQSRDGLTGRKFAIIAHSGTHRVQAQYIDLRLQEQGGRLVWIGPEQGAEMTLGCDFWPWGERGPKVKAELSYGQASGAEFDAVFVTDALSTWRIRGNPEVHELLRQANQAGRCIVSCGRGPKVLMSAGILGVRKLTSGGEVRDDLIQAGFNVVDEAVCVDENLWSCRGTRELPLLMRRLLRTFP